MRSMLTSKRQLQKLRLSIKNIQNKNLTRKSIRMSPRRLKSIMRPKR